MKTQVIQLDPHDDVISIRDKISWAKTPRILLVFPRRSRLRLRNLDLRLLRRHAGLVGGQLAFVSRSKDLRRLAEEEGIPSFKKVSTAQRRQWVEPLSTEPPHRLAPPPDLWQMRREVYSDHPGWQDRPRIRIIFFSAAVLAVLILLILFLPSAVVQLTPATQLQTLAIPVSADLSVSSVNLAGSIPARTLTTFIERSQTSKVSGSVAVPDARAAGKVSLTNLTAEAVLVPAGTVVRTTSVPPVRFATVTDVSVPATPGKSQDVYVRAVAGGTSGNVAAEALVAVEGDLGLQLAVTNAAAMTGGTDKKAPAPTAADRTHLREALEAEILNGCKTTFQQNAGEGALLFPDTLKIAQVSSETFLPPEGQAGDTLSLSLNVQCQMQYASAEDLHSLAEMGMDVNIPVGLEPIADGTVVSAASTPTTDAEGVTHWKMQAQRLLRARLEPMTAVELSQGRSLAGATRRLMAALPLDTSPQITVTPRWWPWLPVFPFRISVSLGG